MDPDPQVWSHLPLDLVAHVVAHLDGRTSEGRRDLLAWTLVSRVVRPIAEARLYRHVTMDPRQLRAFLLNVLGDGSEPAHTRAQKHIRLVESLELRVPIIIRETPVTLLWAAAERAGGPAFPRLRDLVIFETSSYDYMAKYPTASYDAPAPEDIRHAALVPPGVVVFGRVNICVTKEWAYSLLHVLPARSIGSMTTHGIQVSRMLPEIPPWAVWERFTIFHLPQNGWVGDCARADMHRLRSFSHGTGLGNFHLVVPGAGWEQTVLEELNRRPQMGYDMAELPDTVRLSFHDPDDPACPACEVCGDYGPPALLTARRRVQSPTVAAPIDANATEPGGASSAVWAAERAV